MLDPGGVGAVGFMNSSNTIGALSAGRRGGDQTPLGQNASAASRTVSSIDMKATEPSDEELGAGAGTACCSGELTAAPTG